MFCNGQSEAERKAEDLARSIEGSFWNKVKETREKVVSDKERNAGIRENVSCVNTIMDCNE